MTDLPGMSEDDHDAVIAAAELVGRCGARALEVGFSGDENGPIEDADWYAHAQFNGKRVITEGHVGPAAAMERLARNLLGDSPEYEDAHCRRCGKVITLSEVTHVEDPEAKCRWKRQGRTWVPGCGKGIDQTIKLREFQEGK